jgi:hypothetical protein
MRTASPHCAWRGVPGRARRVKVAALAALVLVAVAGSTASASEATAPVATRPLIEALHVTPGATCVEAPALAQEIASWLGTDAIDAGLRIDVTGSAEDPRTVAFQMARGEEILAIRRFSPGPEGCDHLEAAVGLSIALVVRASLLDEITGAVVPVHPAAALPWAVGAQGLLVLGALPGRALGIGGRIDRALPPNFVFRLGVVAIASEDNGFDHVAGTFDAAVVAFRVDACVRADVTRRTHVHGCAGILGGALGAFGHGFAASRDTWTAWSGSADALGVEFDLTARWSVGAEVSIVVPFVQTSVGVRLETGDVADSRQIAAAGGALSVGPLYRF